MRLPSFFTFFSRLTEMMERLAEYLEYFMEFAERVIDNPEVQMVCVPTVRGRSEVN